VKLRTEAGEDYLLAHLLPYDLPRPGTWLAVGARVGWSGSSGNSTGPHLHAGYRPVHYVRGWPYNGYTDPRQGLSGG
jgi:murein DD-endopeptidase MepM/ murein hydrolase activator NlpD